jgi:hypothetical protein
MSDGFWSEPKKCRSFSAGFFVGTEQVLDAICLHAQDNRVGQARIDVIGSPI